MRFITRMAFTSVTLGGISFLSSLATNYGLAIGTETLPSDTDPATVDVGRTDDPERKFVEPIRSTVRILRANGKLDEYQFDFQIDDVVQSDGIFQFRGRRGNVYAEGMPVWAFDGDSVLDVTPALRGQSDVVISSGKPEDWARPGVEPPDSKEVERRNVEYRKAVDSSVVVYDANGPVPPSTQLEIGK